MDGLFYDKVGLLKKMRVSKALTKIMGACYKTKVDFIEIDLTYDCNLKCINCNRSCRQAPSKEKMTVGQIENFIEESMRNKKKWRGIRLIGGEPTLHRDIIKIANMVVNYKKFSPELSLCFATNGCSNSSIIDQIPKDFIIENSKKETIFQNFTPFNLAPIDILPSCFIDFGNACSITELCGLGLTRYGYYHCAIAGSIDRVFGLDIGRKSIPNNNDQMISEKRKLCRYCGHFLEFLGVKKTEKEIVSNSWKKAYKHYQERKPTLSEYKL